MVRSMWRGWGEEDVTVCDERCPGDLECVYEQ